jgi:hypothetical protein
VRATVRRIDVLVIDLPDRAYRDGERVRLSVDGVLAEMVEPLLLVAVSIGGVIDPLYPVYAKGGRRMRAGDVLDGKEHVVAVMAGNGGKLVEE